MIPVNLLPAPHHARRQRRLRLRAWSLGLTAYAVAIAIAAILANLPAQGHSPRLEAELARLDQAAARADTDRTHLTALVYDHTRRINAARAVGEHPDWSGLLTHLARTGQKLAVLEQLELKRETASVSAKSDPTARPASPAAASHQSKDTATITTYALLITGHAATPGAVFEYARALENLGVFDEVTVKDTRNATLGQLPTTRFELRAALADPPRAKEDAQ